MTTKHNLILEHITRLKPGTKISVRKISQHLNVSQGTAYRAIKEAQLLGMVRTIPRVGTVRVENSEKKGIERLTFAEVQNIVDGTVLGGRDGLEKALNKFVVGAMTVDMMGKYISKNDLLIVGNRPECYRLALENQCGVLITGGFECDAEIKALADERQMPIISSTYDTFTVAALINKTIINRMVKKEILLVEDIMTSNVRYLSSDSIIAHWKALLTSTNHSQFPVVDSRKRVIGILTSKDVADLEEEQPVIKVMTKNPITVTPKTSVAYAAHVMIWESIEILPVVDDKQLVGVVSRQDVIRALHYMKSQPQVGEAMEDMVLNSFAVDKSSQKIRFSGRVGHIMLSEIGTASVGALTLVMSTLGTAAIKKVTRMNAVADSFSAHFIKPLQLDDEVQVEVEIIDIGRNYGKVEIMVIHDRKLMAKAMVSVKIFRR
ncbi:MAG: DRTGG domain-containing protein [Mahellales bacterium]|jgi:predicted transcriptional regulator